MRIAGCRHRPAFPRSPDGGEERVFATLTNRKLLAGSRAAGLLLLCLFVSGCSPTTPIADLLEDPRRFDEKTVTIQGDVTGSANLLLVKGFTVRDTTGEIAVVTERAVPRSGEVVKVKGRVKQALAVDETSLVVLVEQSPR